MRSGSRVVTNSGNTVRVRNGNRTVTRSYPYRTYSSRSYSYGYPSYSYGPSVGFGFGYPYYSYGYGYPYGSYYGDYPYGGYPNNYNYGLYYSTPAYGAYGNGSVVITVQSRLARAGYYHGIIDGVMGPETSFAISAYERNHGLRVDGTISRPLLRNMGLRY